MERIIKVACDTRIRAGAAQVRTELTVDASSLSEAGMVAYMVDAAVIKWQAAMRRAGNIPTTATFVVPEPGTRTGGFAVTPLKALVTTFGQERADKMVAKFGSPEAACEAMRALMDEEEI